MLMRFHWLGFLSYTHLDKVDQQRNDQSHIFS